MKTLAQTLKPDVQFAHLYRPLVRNLVLIVAATVLLTAATLVYFDGRLVDSLSEQLIEKSTLTTNEKLQRLFDTARNGLLIARHQIESTDIGDEESKARLFATLTPFLADTDLLDSINLADSSGNEYVPGAGTRRVGELEHNG